MPFSTRTRSIAPREPPASPIALASRPNAPGESAIRTRIVALNEAETWLTSGSPLRRRVPRSRRCRIPPRGGPPRCARRRPAAPTRCSARSPSNDSGSAASLRSGIVGWPSGCSIPSASVCGASATSAMSATGAAGTPASFSRAQPVRRVVPRTMRSPGSHRARRGAAPGRGCVRKRGSSTSSGSPRTPQIAAKSRSLPPAIISSPSRVANTWYGATIGKRVPWPCGTVPSAR